MNIILKDGSSLALEAGATALDAAKAISEGLARNVCAAEINGEVSDLRTELKEGDKLNLLTANDPDGLHTLRHTGSHILAQAVKRLYPEAKLAIGPAISDGFYYDFDVETPFSPEDLTKIEAEMKKVIKEKIPLERFELPREEARKFMEEKGEPYKVELIDDLPEGSVISFYKQGDFTDLCAGPHVPDTGRLKAFKLINATGAYWRGDSNRKMLCRVYAVAFASKEELDEHLRRLEEAKKRDHRRLGRELGLFALLDEGPGFPFFLPKGQILKNKLIDYWREIHRREGYQEISTPMMLNRSLWERSGHWDHYKNNMYTTIIDETNFGVKPMNCPGGMLVYGLDHHSYRDLPLRVGELGLVHRHELSGTLHGLMRVRCFTQDDAHIFMTQEQITDEIKGVVKLIDEVYSTFGFKYYIELSTMPEDHLGDEATWEDATARLAAALDELGKTYEINEGDGAFYGPKIDFHLEDCLGRTWQCGTIQLDFQLPERFELEYIGSDGEPHRPIMIHRVVLGSVERFIGILTEHLAGAFPTWLAPVQTKILTVTDRVNEYANGVAAQLEKLGFRTEPDQRNEKIGRKIRDAQMEKVPYMVILGDRDVENNTVSVRSRSGEDLGAMSLDAFIELLTEKVATKAMD